MTNNESLPAAAHGHAPCKFTSDIHGKLLNGMELTCLEAEKRMIQGGTFYCAPSIAPEGFSDFSAGMNIFPIIGADGAVTGKVIIYEVLESPPSGLGPVFGVTA